MYSCDDESCCTLVASAIIVVISVVAGYNYYAVDDNLYVNFYDGHICDVFFPFSCRPQYYPFYFGYVLPIGIIYIATWIFYSIGFVLLCCTQMTSSEKQFRKDSVLSHIYVGMILLFAFGILWIFALAATEGSIVGTSSTALQYLFSFSAIGHSVVLFILSLIRTRDTRSGWINCLNCVTRRTGKYDFAAQPSTRKGTREVYGLDTSGKFLTDTTTEAMEEKQPLNNEVSNNCL